MLRRGQSFSQDLKLSVTVRGAFVVADISLSSFPQPSTSLALHFTTTLQLTLQIQDSALVTFVILSRREYFQTKFRRSASRKPTFIRILISLLLTELPQRRKQASLYYS